MDIPEIEFIILEDYYCPMYQQGDRFSLAGRTFFTPPGKPTCMTLAGDLKDTFLPANNPDSCALNACASPYIDCSGPHTDCIGVIRLECRAGEVAPESQLSREKEAKLRKVITVLSQFPIFEGLNEKQLKELVALLKFKHFPTERVIVQKGAPGVNLFIIVSGKMEVVGDDGIRLAVLEKGEVFGEMSLISGDPVGATVRVMEPANLLYIRGRDFARIMNKYPSLQMYFARLLTRRLAETNVARSRDFSAGMTGKLSEIPPSELFQTFNVNQKTGALDLSLTRGGARVCFRQGELIRAIYDGKEDTEAFFEILREVNGRFKFNPDLLPEEKKAEPLGDFMWLLMEGIRKIDESGTD